MNKFIASVVALGAAAALPTVAQAQEAAGEGFVGVSVGQHDLGVDADDPDFDGFEIDDSGLIYGAFAGYDFPIGSKAFAGVEGNFHLGTDVIDSEYGVSARVGFRADGGAKFYLRGGYQWIDLDPYQIIDGVDLPEGSLDGIDDTTGDYLVGAGVDFPIGNSALRVNLDTISFDTLRATAGFAFKF